MNAISRLFCIAVTLSALAISACAHLKPSKPLTIPGVDTTTIQVLENDEGRTAVLTGNVRYNVDKLTIEEYVREEYDYEKIINNISIR